MSDIYIPGVRSRFNTEKIIEDLMKVERVPRDRVQNHVEDLRSEKNNWQEVGRRVNSLRTSARLLYSFQNPFSDRTVVSSDEAILSGTATREAVEQERTFTVKQTAATDRFLSKNLELDYKVQEGNYRFSVGEDEISLNFRGGSLKEFTDAVNRRGQDKIKAGVITVRKGSASLLLESLVSGADKKLGFSGAAENLALETGMVERANDSRREITIGPETVKAGAGEKVSFSISEKDQDGKSALTVLPGGRANIALKEAIPSTPNLFISFEAAARLKEPEEAPGPPPGPAISSSGSVDYGGITIENDLSASPLPPWNPPASPARIDDMSVLRLGFSDGTEAFLPALHDSETFIPYQFKLSDTAASKTLVSLDLINKNTHREISLQNVEVFDPDATGPFKPLNPVSRAQDTIISMEGIEVTRPGNTIDDLIPGVTITAKSASDKPVKIGVEPDRESIKEAIVEFVGNYNRLMAELNVLTRNDEKVIQELSYLGQEEQTELTKKLGIFSGETTLHRLRNGLQNAAAAPYAVSQDQESGLLSQIGIGTDVRRAGGSSGYDPSRLRGYLEIDEKALDAAISGNLDTVRNLFGYDGDGDIVVDSGVAYAVETLGRPMVEVGGIIGLKTGTIDNRITQDERRIETLDRQLANKEDTLKRQYGQMEGAYNRMEKMSGSLNNFSRQSGSNN